VGGRGGGGDEGETHGGTSRFQMPKCLGVKTYILYKLPSEHYYILGRSGMYTGISSVAFRRKVLPPSSGSKIKPNVCSNQHNQRGETRAHNALHAAPLI
jgi:hypothetical protein